MHGAAETNVVHARSAATAAIPARVADLVVRTTLHEQIIMVYSSASVCDVGINHLRRIDETIEFGLCD
jgi:hypothetical protein